MGFKDDMVDMALQGSGLTPENCSGEVGAKSAEFAADIDKD